MLAGYLPFDDDPANPEGDNINLLYKYIVSTPLTFPEYVTPHARDLLKRILVPDPRKRADLFEVARHSWLAEYAHVVGFITSSTTTPNDISNTTVPAGTSSNEHIIACYEANCSTEESYEPHLARSASVREPTKAHNAVAQIGGLQKQAPIDNEKAKTTRDAKRRTVQVEYVAPQSATTRGEQSKTRARGDAQGPVEVPLPEGYPTPSRPQERTAPVPTSMPPPTSSHRPARGQVRATSEHVAAGSLPPMPTTRPSTQGSMSGARLSSRGNSYSQPAVAVAPETAQARFSQPRGKQYTMATPASDLPQEYETQDSEEQYSSDPKRSASKSKGHKRSSTLGELFGKRGSIFGGKKDADKPATPKEKPSRSHPPVSMKPMPMDNPEPRRSTDSRRTSFSFTRKNTSSDGSNRGSRRFSFIPSFSNSRTSTAVPPDTADSNNSRHDRMDSRPKMAFGRGESRSPSRSTTASTIPVLGDPSYDGRVRDPQRQRQAPTSYPNDTDSETAQHNRLPSNSYPQNDNFDPSDMHFSGDPNHGGNYYRQVSGSTTAPSMQQDEYGRFRPLYPTGFNEGDQGVPSEGSPVSSRREKNVLQKPHRQFPDNGGQGKAKRVMDFFRMRGRARTEA